MTQRYPSANRNQRAWRARHPRIDYYPSVDALRTIHAALDSLANPTTLSSILNRIIAEWESGRKRGRKDPSLGRLESPPTTSVPQRNFYDDFLAFHHSACATPPQSRFVAAQAPVCGARRHRDGQPCQAKPEPGRQRCRWHGGRSTGPRTRAGKKRAMANLKQNRRIAREP